MDSRSTKSRLQTTVREEATSKSSGNRSVLGHSTGGYSPTVEGGDSIYGPKRSYRVREIPIRGFLLQAVFGSEKTGGGDQSSTSLH